MAETVSLKDTTAGGTGWKVGVTDGCVCCEREGDTDAESERETDAVRPAERERDMVREDVLVGEIVPVWLGVCVCVAVVEAVWEGVRVSRGVPEGVVVAEMLGVSEGVGVAEMGVCVRELVPVGEAVSEAVGVDEAVTEEVDVADDVRDSEMLPVDVGVRLDERVGV